MEKGYLIKLTLALYKVTELFPKKEPLKFSLRERAGEILADSILFFAENPIALAKEQKSRAGEQILRNIEILEGYFGVAEVQKWVDKRNFLVLKREYGNIREEIETRNRENKNKIKEKKFLDFSSAHLGNERSKKILEILREKEKAQVREFKKIFPELSKRTLRRDFEFLLSKNLVERIGDGKFTFYKIK